MLPQGNGFIWEQKTKPAACGWQRRRVPSLTKITEDTREDDDDSNTVEWMWLTTLLVERFTEVCLISLNTSCFVFYRVASELRVWQTYQLPGYSSSPCQQTPDLLFWSSFAIPLLYFSRWKTAAIYNLLGLYIKYGCREVRWPRRFTHKYRKLTETPPRAAPPSRNRLRRMSHLYSLLCSHNVGDSFSAFIL